MNDEQLASLRKIFSMFDQGKTGFVETSKFVNILNTLGQTFNEDDLAVKIKEVDSEGSGKVNFDKFCDIVNPFVEEEESEVMVEELKEAFRLYDREGNGYISTETLREILKELDNKLTEENLDEVIEEIDEDGSGTVDFDEFMGDDDRLIELYCD